MKRWLCFGVALILWFVLGAANSETVYRIPQRAEQLKQELDELPMIKTKQSDETLTVYVDGDVDYLLANWQGYMEQPEEIELIDGVGIVETKGHKYQLGARWNNYFRVIPVEHFFRYEDVSDEELKAYFDALVEYGDARVAGMNPIDVIVKHLVPEYRTRRTIETYDAETGETTKEAIILKSSPVDQVSDEELQSMMEELPDDTHVESDDGSRTDTWYAISESAYKVLEYAIGLDSNGSPDRAYLANAGNYVLAWGRSGKLKTATKILADHDCFETGIPGATSYVIWDNTLIDGHPYISDVVTYYPEGSTLASINAEYNSAGNLKRATVIYADGHRETALPTASVGAKDSN